MDRRLMGETRTARLAFIATIGLSVLVGLLIIGQAFLLSRVIFRVFLDNAALNDVLPLLGGLALLVLLRATLHAAKTVAAAQVAIRVKADLRDRLVTHMLSLGPAFTARERSGELSLTAIEGIEALDAFFRDYLPAIFIALLIPLVILLVVLPLDLLTFFILLLTAPLIPVFMALIGMAAGRLAKKQYGVMSRMSAHFLDVMQGLTTLKLFNRSLQQVETIRKITDRFRETTMDVLRLAFMSAFVLELLATLSVAIVAVEIGLRLLNGGIGFEEALFLLVIAPEFYLPLRELGAKFHAGRDGAAAADRIFAVLEVVAPERSGTQPPPQRMTIAFENVAFAYGDRPALHDISLTIPDGHTIALVGASGSGKTTIANLLLRFIKPDQGTITADGIDLTTIDPDLWRSRIAWVPQQPYLFNRSAAENIAIGRDGASRDELIAAAQAASAHEFIIGLEKGYDTILGERGARLSGGQAQRIALARAFLRDAPLVILDEATANLDAGTETEISAAIERLTQGRTVLVIAHRLNTIVNADTICVVDDGRIVQRGTHSQLMTEGGAYRKLVELYGAVAYE